MNLKINNNNIKQHKEKIKKNISIWKNELINFLILKYDATYGALFSPSREQQKRQQTL